jgi:hypothetical protein
MTRIRVTSPLRMAAGASGTLRVTVINSSQLRCDHRIEILGLDPEWTAPAVTSGPLDPGTSADLELVLAVPAGAPAGTYPFLVTVQPLSSSVGGTREAAVEADAEVVVGEASRLALTLFPREPRGARRARFEVLLENGTAEPLDLTLSAHSSRELFLTLGRRPVTIPAGGHARLPVRATVSRTYSGQQRRIPFTLVAHGPTKPVELTGTFVARPTVGAGLTKVVAVLAVIALWAAVSLVAINAIKKHQSPGKSGAAASISTQAGKPTPAAPGGAAGGAGGAGQAGGAGEAGGAATSRASAVASPRLNGVVTGAAAGGVHVRLDAYRVDSTMAALATVQTGAAPASGALVPVAYRTSITTKIRPSSPATFVPLSTTTSTDGAWSIPGVKVKGQYLLSFAKPGYKTLRYVINQDGSELPALKTALLPATGSASGVVSFAGKGLGSATVVVTDGDSTATTITNRDGAWSVTGLSLPGTFVISATAPGKALASTLVTYRNDTPQRTDLTLVEGVQTLSGSIGVTGPGDPGGITVVATSGSLTRTTTTVTLGVGAQRKGYFSLPNLPLGDYVVTYSLPGFATSSTRVTLKDARSGMLTPLPLRSAGFRLAGKVTAGEPTDLAGLTLMSSTATFKTTTTDGTYAFDDIPAGDYVLTVEKYKFRLGVASVSLPYTLKTPFDVTLKPATAKETSGSIEGEVVSARTTGVFSCPAGTGTTCLTITDRPRPPRPGDLPGDKHFDPTAVYTLTPLEAGLHYLTFSADGYDSLTIAIQVREGLKTIAPRVALQPKAGLVGRITPATAAPLPLTCVIALRSDAQSAPAAPTCTLPVSGTPACTTTGVGAVCAKVDATTGSYTLDKLPEPGAYFVYVVPVDPGHPDWAALPGVPFTLAPGETRRYDAALTRAGRIHLTVRAPSAAGGLEAPAQALVATLNGSSTTYPIPANAGDVLIPGLADGTYSLEVHDSGLTVAGSDPTVTVGSNQTTESSVVVTQKQPSVFVGRVTWSQDSVVHGVEGAKVTITGTTGYTGTVENRQAQTVTTNAQGCYAVTPTGTAAGFTVANPIPPECGPGSLAAQVNIATLSLLSPKITVKADATQVVPPPPSDGSPADTDPVFGSSTIATTIGGGLVPSSVSVLGVPFTGTVAASSPGADLTTAKLTVTTAAAGSGSIVIAPNAAGSLRWTDSTENNVANVVHPGTYQVTAHLADHDDASGTLTCHREDSGARGAPCSLTLTVQSYVDLPVVVRDATGSAVPGSLVTLSGAGIATTTVAVPAGTDRVTFPGLSVAAVPYTVRVRAPGFDAFQTSISSQLVSGQATPPQTATLTRLGAFTGILRGSVGAQLTPLAGITVTATRSTAGQPDEVFSGVTGADGRYLVTGTAAHLGLPLDGGPWTVAAVVPTGSGYADQGAGTASLAFLPAAANDDSLKTVSKDLVLLANPVQVQITVKDDRTAAGTLVSGAKVSLTGPDNLPKPMLEDPATAPGVYAASGLNPTTYTLTVTAANHSPLTTTITLEPGRPVTQISILIADRRNALAVHVQGQTGNAAPAPLAGATVSVTSGATPVAGSPFTTLAPGDVQVSGLDDGTYHVVIAGAAGSGFGSVARDVTLASGQLAGLEATLQRVLPAVRVTVTSTSGASLAGALVSLVATGAGANSQAAQQAVDTAGTVGTQFNQVEPGSYLITTSGPAGHQPSSTPLTVLITDAPTVTTPVQVQESALDLTLTGASSVRASVAVAAAGGDVQTLSVFGDGQHHTVYVPPGAWSVSAAAPGFTIAEQTGSGSAAVPLVLTASQTGTATVHVTEGGSPVSNATVTVAGSSLTYSTGPDHDDVVVGGLGAGSHNVTVLLPDGQSKTVPATITVGANTNVPVAFAAPTSPATGTLTVTVSRDGSPLPGATVTLTAQPAAVTTNASGNATFTGLVAGTYAVTASKDGRTVTSNATTTVPSSTVSLDLTVSTAAVKVTVTDSGSPVRGATVVVQSSTGSASGSTDAAGVVTLGGLPAGSYTVTASTADGRSTSGPTTVTLSTGSTTSTAVTVAATNGRLVVTVTRAGSAQAGATVTVTGGAAPVSVTTDVNGRAVFEGLAPRSSYSVSATFTSGPTTYTGSGTVAVVSGGTAASSIVLT